MSPIDDTIEPFSEFMARALFDPKLGYYSRRVSTVGRGGDFSTSPTLNPLLGQAIGRWLRQAMAELPSVHDVIEIGAGTGVLLHQVRKSLGWWNRRQLRWHIVETSPVLREQQQATLRGCRVSWWTDLEQALTATGGCAFIYHNELLDAFPCQVLQRTENGWQELWLASSKGAVVSEQWQPFSPPPWASALTPNWSPPIGQRIELHATVRHWLSSWVPLWRSGQMLTIDYGDLFPAVYHRRPRGSLRGYFLQHRVDGPALYQNVGRQDLTADINFTDYRQWTEELGMQEIAFLSQADFIAQHGLRPQTPGEQQWLATEGAGGAFKILLHQCG